MGDGSRPGLKTQLKAVSIDAGTRTISFVIKDDEDVKYFGVGNDYLAEFHALAAGQDAGDAPEPSGS